MGEGNGMPGSEMTPITAEFVTEGSDEQRVWAVSPVYRCSHCSTNVGNWFT